MDHPLLSKGLIKASQKRANSEQSDSFKSVFFSFCYISLHFSAIYTRDNQCLLCAGVEDYGS